MPEFPKHARVNLSSAKFLDGQCSVSVRINPEDDVRSLQEVYGARLQDFEIDGESLLDTEFVRTLEHTRVRIMPAARGLFESSQVVDALVCLEPVFVVTPDAKLIRNVNFLTSLNFRVHVDASAQDEAQDSLERVTDFYLHNPVLATPIEPFHTLLHTVSRGRGYSLWDTEAEKVGISFYVSDKGEISLSRRWNVSGLNYGTLDDSWDKIVNSDLFRSLSSFRLALFKNKSQCIFCSYLDLCGGFLRALDGERPCELWQQVFSILRDEAKKAKELQQKIEQMLTPKSDVK